MDMQTQTAPTECCATQQKLTGKEIETATMAQRLNSWNYWNASGAR